MARYRHPYTALLTVLVLFAGGWTVAARAADDVILDASRYRDWGGNTGTYRFDAASSAVTFQGAALGGQRVLYKQAVDPPTRKTPAQVFFQPSGDGCDWVSG